MLEKENQETRTKFYISRELADFKQHSCKLFHYLILWFIYQSRKSGSRMGEKEFSS